MEELEKVMRERGYSEASLARAVGMSASSISRKMRGLVPWFLDDVREVTRVLQLTRTQVMEIWFPEE